MQHRPKLLHPFVRALIALEDPYVLRLQDLEASFALVAARRPDLLSKSLFAERARSTSQIEKILRDTLRELETVAAEEGRDSVYVPDFRIYRFSHATGVLHMGESHRSIALFPETTEIPE